MTGQPTSASAAPPLEILERRPTDPRWRSDLLAQSTHGRLAAPEMAPTADATAQLPDEAAGGGAEPVRIASGKQPGRDAAGAPPGEATADPLDARCAEIARELLGDFAPALLLLPATERTRVRTLLAHARTLLDGARQLGFEGERLALINRWEAAIERGLEGRTAGLPPICRRMAQEHARRRWPADALDELTACARRRVLRPRPATAVEVEAEARSLARAVGGALLEARLNAEVNSFGGALIRLRALQRVGQALASGYCPLPEDEWPVPAGPPQAGALLTLVEAVERECRRLRPCLLRAPRGLIELPAAYRRAGVFALLAALRLLSEIEEAGAGLLTAAPHLRTSTRVGLLVRARWFGPRVRTG
jgi:phytoene/squalene synthetase